MIRSLDFKRTVALLLVLGVPFCLTSFQMDDAHAASGKRGRRAKSKPAAEKTDAAKPAAPAKPAKIFPLAECDQMLADKLYVKAINAYGTYIYSKPKDYKGYFGRAKAEFGMFQTNDGIDDLNKAIALSPKTTDLYKLRGEKLVMWGEFDRAIKDLSFALNNGNPAKFELLTTRTEAYRLLGNHSKVVEDLTLALQMKDDPDLHLKRADSLYEMRKYKDAVEDYSVYIKAHPDSNSQRFRRAWCLEQFKEYDKAIEDYTYILQSNNLNAKALERRAGDYYAKGEYQKALKDCNTALGDFRGYSAAGLYKLRAQIYGKLGKGGMAAKDLSKIRRKKSKKQQ